MPSYVEAAANKTDDPMVHIARLRKDVEALMQDHVTPALAEAAGRVGSAAYGAAVAARDQAKIVSGRVRNRPIAALLISVAIGFVLGRASP